MQVRRARPDSVQRLIGVARRFSEMGETVFRIGVEAELVHRELGGVGIEAMAVGADRVGVLDEPDAVA